MSLLLTGQTPHRARRHLSLSTNNIDKISGLAGLENLKILSLGRNLLKKIEGLDAVAGTLEEFWLSYNGPLASLAGLEKCSNLRILYLSNCKISSWNEVERLAPLSKLEELLLVGNPLYNEFNSNNAITDYRLQVRGWGGRGGSKGRAGGEVACMQACGLSMHPLTSGRWLLFTFSTSTLFVRTIRYIDHIVEHFCAQNALVTKNKLIQ